MKTASSTTGTCFASKTSTKRANRAAPGFTLKRGLAMAAAACASFGQADALNIIFRFGGSAVSGALTLPTSFAPRIQACLKEDACHQAGLTPAAAIMWRQSMQVKNASFFGYESLAGEAASLSKVMDWQIAKFEGMIGFPAGLPVLDNVLFGNQFAFRKTSQDPLGCNKFNRAIDAAFAQGGVAVVGEYHNTRESKHFRSCLFNRIHQDKIVVVLEGVLQGPAMPHLLRAPRHIAPVSPGSLHNVSDRVRGLEIADLHALASAVNVHGRLSVDVDSQIEPPKSLQQAVNNFLARAELAPGIQRRIDVLSRTHEPYADLASALHDVASGYSKVREARLNKVFVLTSNAVKAKLFAAVIAATVTEADPAFKLSSVQDYLDKPSPELFEVAYYATTVRARDRSFAMGIKAAQKDYPDHRVVAIVGLDHALHTGSLAAAASDSPHDEL